MASLLVRHGCIALSAPSMREVPLSDESEVLAFGEHLLAGDCDVLVLLTGVGLRVLVDALATRWPQADVIAALGKTTLVSRGPKPVAVLKTLGLRASAVAPEPNTWRTLLDEISRSVPVAGKRVAIQEYGRPSPELAAGLRELGAEVTSVAVYAWALPHDLGPLRRAVDILCSAQADVLTVTSGRQIEHLLDTAAQLGKRDALLAALRDDVLVASIGPMATETLQEHGVKADLEPVHPKMGQLVIAVAQQGAEKLASKRAAASPKAR
jgi:uroporphyrinogen-III synthase